MWYRYCRLIIAGKEHIIKNVINYFREQGESEVNLNEISQKLNVLDKSQKLPIIERRKKSIFFNNQEFTKFLDFSEKVDRLFSEHLRNEKTKEQKKIQKEEKTEFIPGKISVYPCKDVNDTIKYGAGTSWCVSQPGNGMYHSYRNQSASTFYYIQDGTRDSSDPLSRVMLDVQDGDEITLTDTDNDTGTIAEFGTNVDAYLDYLENNGVNTAQFVNKPLTNEEREEFRILGQRNNDLEWFKNLSLDYKFKYIGRGHRLTDEQLSSIINLESVDTKKIALELINDYVNTGLNLPLNQQKILFEINPQIQKTYKRRRAIAIEAIRKYYFNNTYELKNYALQNKDLELIDSIIEEKGIEEFKNARAAQPVIEYLLSKGLDPSYMKWQDMYLEKLSEDFIIKYMNFLDIKLISHYQKLSEDFIRKYSDLVDWRNISYFQKLSENFIEEFKDRVDWREISSRQTLSEDFIRKFQDKIQQSRSWSEITQYQNLSEEFMDEFQNKLDWEKLSDYHENRKYGQKLSIEFLLRHKDKIDWETYSHQYGANIAEEYLRALKDYIHWGKVSYHNVSDEFLFEYENYINWKKAASTRKKIPEILLRRHADDLNWYHISAFQNLSEDFMRDFADRFNWIFISELQNLSEDFIREFKDRVDWYYISEYQTLSEDFIREFQDKVKWAEISVYQKLSEDFIREFQEKVVWHFICRYQTLSEDFIREFQNKVYWDKISGHQKLSEDFIREFQDRVKLHYLLQNKNLSDEIKHNLQTKGYQIKHF